MSPSRPELRVQLLNAWHAARCFRPLRHLGRRIEIFIGPQFVTLKCVARKGASLSREYACPDSEGDLWRGALMAIERALAEQQWRNARAKIYLSNHFVRYALLPAASALRNDTERVTAARHQLHTRYGESAQNWYAVPGFIGGECNIAAGIDQALIDALASLLRAAQLDVQSIEPLLALQFNRCRAQIGAAPAWLVSIEAGRLCLAYFERGAWRSLHSEKTALDREIDLPLALARHRLAIGAAPGKILIFESYTGVDLDANAQIQDWPSADIGHIDTPVSLPT